MEYGHFDSSGTDDDLPLGYNGRNVIGGRVTSSGRGSVGVPHNMVQTDMETLIHQIEKDAYCAVIRAFKAQGDAITWEKEGLMTELRKELRVSDDEHRELLGRVNADDVIQRIREWREAGGVRSGFVLNTPAVHEPIYGPSVSASRKKQKLGIPTASLAFESPMQPCTAAIRSEDLQMSSKSRVLSGTALRKSAWCPSTGRVGVNQTPTQGFSGSLTATELAKSTPPDQFIGRKVSIRSHADNNFYEAVVVDYNSLEGQHALVYDSGTANEAVEWINLKEISPEDIRWEEHQVSSRAIESGHGGVQGIRSPTSRGRAISGAGRGRGTIKLQTRKDLPLPRQETTEKEGLDEIKLPIAENIIKEAERLLSFSNPDLFEIEKAKKCLMDHEQCLLNALAKLDASNRENEESNLQHEQPENVEAVLEPSGQHGEPASVEGLVG